MNEYNQFVSTLKSELSVFLSEPKKKWATTAQQYVDGKASEELRSLIPIETRRQYGAFFTHSTLAKRVFSKLKPAIDEASVVYDPTCGAGNLLIAFSDYIRKNKIKSANTTYLLGTDLHQSFIDAAELRIQMNFLLKEQTKTVVQNGQDFKLCKADGLSDNQYYKTATHIIVNPPFNQIIASEKVEWAQGKISAAALFLDKIIQYTSPGTSIIAILPDVLRSGSRYVKWRKMIQENCTIVKKVLFEQFDKYTDVDVYAVHLVKKTSAISETKKSLQEASTITAKKNQTLKYLFEICVGPVIDNRDKKDGIEKPYLVSKGLIGWSTVTAILKSRQYLGKSFQTPFVVIKRISRMSDNDRAVAVIIDTPESVYVDNHLIILIPKSGRIRECRKAINLLRDQRTNDWLNKQIRCRHLTVSIVANIPVWI